MQNQTHHEKLIRWAAVLSVLVAIGLIVIKGGAWWLSGSVSLLAGLTDSVLDGVTSGLNLLAVMVALKPADYNHRYGHGKAEALAGFVQSLLIMVTAVVVAWQGVIHLLSPEPLKSTLSGVVVTAISMGVTVVLLSFQRYVVRKTQSTAIAADALHYRSDLLLNGSILLALLLSGWGWHESDALFGIVIAFYIFWSAILIGKEAVSVLMDSELPSSITDEMIQKAKSIEGVLDIHDLRTRKSGNRWFIQLHAELPAMLSLQEAHQRCIEIRRVLQENWPRLDVTIHADPR